MLCYTCGQQADQLGHYNTPRPRTSVQNFLFPSHPGAPHSPATVPPPCSPPPPPSPLACRSIPHKRSNCLGIGTAARLVPPLRKEVVAAAARRGPQEMRRAPPPVACRSWVYAGAARCGRCARHLERCGRRRVAGRSGRHRRPPPALAAPPAAPPEQSGASSMNIGMKWRGCALIVLLSASWTLSDLTSLNMFPPEVRVAASEAFVFVMRHPLTAAPLCV